MTGGRRYFHIEESQSHLYPRCEYRTRFYWTSAFEMSQPAYWGSYFRYGSDRLVEESLKFLNKNETFRDNKTDQRNPCGFKNSFEVYRDKHKWQIETVKQPIEVSTL